MCAIRTTAPVVVAGLLCVCVLASMADAQRGRGPRGGQGRGGHGGGPRHGRDAAFAVDRETFQFLLAHHDRIRRQVTNLDNGVETLTESDDPEITGMIQQHVAGMYARVKNGQPIHRRDPLFAALFDHVDKIEMKHEDTARGVRVIETSQDPYVAQLIQAHARVVSLFVENGFDEAHRDHDVPPRADGNTRGGDANDARRAVAFAAREALFKGLLARLKSALATDGPVGAIAVCREQAPQLAKEISASHQLAIGRTSFRLRNPKNQPPAWAAGFVAQRTTEPRFVELSEDKLGALLPITTKAQCVMCHGPAEHIPAAVRQALSEHYPDDRATGFHEGDLRGWFWVEVSRDSMIAE